MTTVPAKYVPAIQSVLKSIPYTAPEIMGTMLYERLVHPLQRQLEDLTAELDRLRQLPTSLSADSEVGPPTPTQTDQAGAGDMVTLTKLESHGDGCTHWRRPSDEWPPSGCPVLACYGTAPALVYITHDAHVWADWTTGTEEPIPDYWAELPAMPEGDA